MDMSLSKLWKMVKYRKAWHAAVHGITKSKTGLSYSTTREVGNKIKKKKKNKQKTHANKQNELIDTTHSNTETNK